MISDGESSSNQVYILVRVIYYGMTTKTISIHRDTRICLMDLIDEDTSIVDAVVNHVLDMVESELNDSTKQYYGNINVDVSMDTLNRIKELKLTDTESYNSVLNRALILYKSIMNI